MSEKLNDFHEIIWRSNLSRQVDDFKSVLHEDDNSEKYFNHNFLEKMVEKSSKINQVFIKYSILYLFVIISLYATLNINGVDIEIGPLSLKNLDKYKEFLLFISSILLPVSVMALSYNNYIDSLIHECVEKIAPDKEVRDFYKHAWVDSLSEVMFKKVSSKEHVYEHGFSYFLTLSLLLLLILILVSFVLAGLFVHLAVIYDVAFNPVSSGYINKFVVFFSCISIAYSLLVIIIQLPLPEVDYKNLDIIKELEITNPDEYQKVINRIAIKNERKEVYYLIILTSLIYMLTYISSIFLLNDFSFPEISEILPKAITGSVVVLFLSAELFVLIKKVSLLKFAKLYPVKSDERTNAYIKLERAFSICKVLTPFVFTLIYVFFL
ncbi:TPA: hypothetical protein NKY78_000710 [Vibrio parahaemolyticus]|nr:hypothetical protein [Vibrio parahaemolyticus]